jgi:hypothetical protein
MKKWQEVAFFLFCAVFVMFFSVSLYAEENTATMQTEPEVEYVESTSITPKVEQVIKKETKLPEALEVEPVKTTAQGIPQAVGQPTPLPLALPIGEKILGVEPVQGSSIPSGLLEVNGFKYPVFLFVPKDYKTDRTYAMIMIAPDKNAKAEEQIEYLTGLAQRKSIFILAPYVLWPKGADTPYRLDDWLLTVKKDMVERFPINKKRIYLVGKDLGAHYAAYLGIKCPKEFAAVALLGQAWDGPFSPLIRPRSDVADQVPFYIALKAEGEVRSRNQVWFDELQKKGYPLHLVDYKSDEELNDLEFKKSVFDWMESAGENWEAAVAQSQKTWKGKFKKGVKDFFAV